MTSNVLSAVLDVFDCIGEWIIAQLNNMVAIFWTTGDSGGTLTFLGVLAVTSLGIGVIFLLIRVVQNFLHFRG